MFLHPQLALNATLARGIRPGLALATALFGLVVVGLLTASAWTLVEINNSMSSNREDAARAQLVAEAGLNHALGLMRGPLKDTSMTRLLRGWDGARNTADDGYLTGYGLAAGLQIPSTGVNVTDGTYFVRLIDDPAEFDNDPLQDRNFRILARCRGVTPKGSVAEVNAVIGNNSLPGVAVNGPLGLAGNTLIEGPCGSAHSNDNLTVGGNNVKAEAGACSAGSMSGTVYNNDKSETYGACSNADSVEIPILNAATYCGRADYILRNGGLALDALGNVISAAALGWTRTTSGGLVYWDTSAPVAGTYCIEGNVRISGSVGTSANPLPLTIIAYGSVQMSGTPFIKAADPDGLLILADGDVAISGNPSATGKNFDGFVYAGAQCQMSGTSQLHGQLVCADGTNPVGSASFATANSVSGTATINFGCGGFLGEVWKVIAWYPTIGA